jgi:hypothetical protein
LGGEDSVFGFVSSIGAGGRGGLYGGEVLEGDLGERKGETYTFSYSQIAFRNFSWMSQMLYSINPQLLESAFEFRNSLTGDIQ